MTAASQDPAAQPAPGATASAQPSFAQPSFAQPSFARWMGSLWLFTVLRFGLFFAVWGLLVLVGLDGLFAALLAAVLSLPLSFVLLAAPRRRVAANLEARVAARQQAKADLDRRLGGDGEAGEAGDPTTV